MPGLRMDENFGLIRLSFVQFILPRKMFLYSFFPNILWQVAHPEVPCFSNHIFGFALMGVRFVAEKLWKVTLWALAGMPPRLHRDTHSQNEQFDLGLIFCWVNNFDHVTHGKTFLRIFFSFVHNYTSYINIFEQK